MAIHLFTNMIQHGFTIDFTHSENPLLPGMIVPRHTMTLGVQVSAANAQIQTAVAREKDALERCRSGQRWTAGAVRFSRQ